MKSHGWVTPLSRTLAAVAFVFTMSACGSDRSDPLSPAVQPEIINNTDSFSFQVTGVSNASATLNYTWQNTGTVATVNQSASISAGSATLIIRDAAGTQVYSRSLSEERLADVTRRIIEEAVARGHAVLVGRGAQSVLGRRADVLHVFCYAPRDALVRRVAQRRAISASEAEKIVDEINKQRDHYVRTTFKRSWKAHENYHLCVNTEWLGLDGAADLIVTAARAMGF